MFLARTTIILVISLVVAGTLLPTTGVCSNGVDRGGGDAYEQECRLIGHTVADKLRSLRAEYLARSGAGSQIEIAPALLEVDVGLLLEKVDSVPVISTNEPVLVMVDGKPVPRAAAYSYTEKIIIVNVPMWKDLTGDRISKESLLFHEYLRSMDLERAYEVSIFYRQRLEREADTTQFKAELTEQTKNLGIGLAHYFKASLEPVFARIETVGVTAEYRRCVDRSSRASEQERLADCFDVTAMFLRAAKLLPLRSEEQIHEKVQAEKWDVLSFLMIKDSLCGGEPPRAIINRLFLDPRKKWKKACAKIDEIVDALCIPYKLDERFETHPESEQFTPRKKFLAFANALSEPRKQYALAIYKRLTDEFESSESEAGAVLQKFKATNKQECPGDLSAAIACLVPKMVNGVARDLAAQMQSKEQKLTETTSQIVQGIAAYGD